MDSFKRDEGLPKDVEKFIYHWNKDIEEKINKNSLTQEAADNIRKKYNFQKSMLSGSLRRSQRGWEFINSMQSLDSKLEIALGIAQGKYLETEKPIRKSKWETIKEFLKTTGEAIKKIPPLNLIKCII